MTSISVEPCGDAWVMVDWHEHPNANTAARALGAHLRHKPPSFCKEVVAGVRTLAVRLAFDASHSSRASHREAALECLRDLAPQALQWQAPAGKKRVLPACYDTRLAPDLDDVARATGLSTQEVIAIHSGSSFLAEVIGFMPGFAYLGGLDERLKLPRRSMPRPKVPQGSVSIAGLQTAIYPSSTPGGWHLIARCPTLLFDPARSPAALMGEGDTIHFEPIDKALFDTLWAKR